jgi:hypothetical protein
MRSFVTVSCARGPKVNIVCKLEIIATGAWRRFCLSVGYPERWGKEVSQQSSVTITLTDEQLAALTEGLRYVRAGDVTPPIEARATIRSGETPSNR